MSESRADRVCRYRLRAAEVRQLSATILDPDSRQALELIAERYERMAQILQDDGE